MPETVVPVVFFLVVVGLPVTAWIISRTLAHAERMEMIRRGFAPPPDPRAMRSAMRYGAKMGFAPGTMPPPGFVAPPGVYDSEYYAQHQLRRGIQVAFIGLALLIGLSFIGYRGGEYVFGPWLLGGLIPMFVGVAQIISAVLSGARIGTVGAPAAGGTQFGPPEGAEVPPAGASAGTTTAPGSYGGWRPGATPEIGKPPSPPDYRG